MVVDPTITGDRPPAGTRTGRYVSARSACPWFYRDFLQPKIKRGPNDFVLHYLDPSMRSIEWEGKKGAEPTASGCPIWVNFVLNLACVIYAGSIDILILIHTYSTAPRLDLSTLCLTMCRMQWVSFNMRSVRQCSQESLGVKYSSSLSQGYLSRCS